MGFSTTSQRNTLAMTRTIPILLLACGFLGRTLAEVHHVPLFTARELRDSSSRLEHALTTTGIIALPLSSIGGSSRNSALRGLCECATSPAFSKLEGGDKITLFDGQTTRQSLATATVGNSPLPLGQDLARTCGSETADAMESLRDQVADASKLFLEAFDQLVGNPDAPILQNSYGGTYHSVASIVQGASNLEHFHVYSKAETVEADAQPALRVHTDAGLFLAFVPALDCQGNSDESFFLKDENKNLQKAIFPPKSVVIMLGAGAEHWLKTSVPLKATRHSVQIEQGVSRVWYGMMHLVPESAIVEESPQQRTFGEMRQAMILKSQSKTTRRFSDDPMNKKTEDISIGCGFSDMKEIQSESISATSASRRRRLQHVENAGACNNVTNFYCWMSCLDIPNHERASAFLKEGYELYCVDPSIVASSGGVGEAQEPCIERGIVGRAMNSNCMGMWQPSAPGVVHQEVIVEDFIPDDFDEPFCYGGTSMYMDGFQWLGTTCPIYLFPNLVLDSAGALVGACFFTILFGIALEWVIQQRRVTVRSYPPGYKRLAASATFYGIQLTMGYAIMLIVMIYSIPLFVSVVAGVVSGHVLFSASDAIWRKGTAAVSAGSDTVNDKWSDDPEEVEGQEQSLPPSEKSVLSRRVKKEPGAPIGVGAEIPEGITPCCQNEL